MLPLCSRTDMQNQTCVCLVLTQLLNNIHPSQNNQKYLTSTPHMVLTAAEVLIMYLRCRLNLRQHYRGKCVRRLLNTSKNVDAFLFPLICYASLYQPPQFSSHRRFTIRLDSLELLLYYPQIYSSTATFAAYF